MEVTTTPKIVFIFIGLAKARAEFGMFLVLLPMGFGAMSWPAAVRTLVPNRDRLVLSETDGTRRNRADVCSALLEVLER